MQGSVIDGIGAKRTAMDTDSPESSSSLNFHSVNGSDSDSGQLSQQTVKEHQSVVSKIANEIADEGRKRQVLQSDIRFPMSLAVLSGILSRFARKWPSLALVDNSRAV